MTRRAREPLSHIGGSPSAGAFVLRMSLTYGLLLALPLLLTLDVARSGFVHGHVQSVDFGQEFWPAASRVVHGLDPYNISWQRVKIGIAFPYPAFTALFFVPFALIPHGLSDDLWTGLAVLSLVSSLRLLDVRDWRLYGLVFLFAPVLDAWRSANLTLMLCLGIALMWRHRERPFVTGLTAALLISLKPFVWPIALWLLATRRYLAAAYALGCVLTINAAAFGLLGFGAIHGYLHVSQLVTSGEYRVGYTLVALGLHAGVAAPVATGIAITAAIVVALLTFQYGQRGCDEPSMTFSVALILLATPVLWNHYFALLLVPLAVARRRLTPIWLAPLAWWACPATPPAAWQILVAWLIASLAVCVIVRNPSVEAVGNELSRPPRHWRRVASALEGLPLRGRHA
jgi:hypothetical protein